MNNINYIVSQIMDSDLVHVSDDDTLLLSVGFDFNTSDATNYMIHYIARLSGKIFPLQDYLEAKEIIKRILSLEIKYYWKISDSIPVLTVDPEFFKEHEKIEERNLSQDKSFKPDYVRWMDLDKKLKKKLTSDNIISYDDSEKK